MSTDPLSDVLSLLKPRSSVSAGFEADGRWAVRFDDRESRIKCYVVTEGSCWLGVEGQTETVRIGAGECFVLPSGRPFRLGSDLETLPVEADTIFPPSVAGGVVRLNGGGSFALVGSRFALENRHAGTLLASLPAIIHVRGAADEEAFSWLVRRMRSEIAEGRAGSALVAQHLAHLMLVEALRLHLNAATPTATGWFAALADPRLAAAIEALHSDPAHRWTLGELARVAGMSRSSFALAFRARTAETPMTYLGRWRMMLAADRLERGDRISSIASALGHASEAAFSTAFKRIVGRAPQSYRKSR